MTARLLIGDVFERMAELPDHSVDLVVTSPPFWRQRAYLPADHPDKGKEIGQEASPAEFIAVLLRLTAEWRRLLTPYGSIAVELGDTMAGSGGAGGDYGDGGFRDGQPRWNGSAMRAGTRAKSCPNVNPKSYESGTGLPAVNSGALPKSHTMIPELYRAALAYGDWPILTGNPHPAGRWIVRNTVRRCSPNPTPGADGDKFRRATSDIVCATLNPRRYWDGDAVRETTDRQPQRRNGQPEADHVISGWTHTQVTDSDGTRPLYDHWLIAPQGYAGAHYAVWTPEIARRLILAMSPARVCQECGEPSRRIVEKTRLGLADDKQRVKFANGERPYPGLRGRPPEEGWEYAHETLGWSDCGHGSVTCKSCHVLVPYDYALRRPRSTQGGEAEVREQALLVEPVQGAGRQAEAPSDLRGMRRGLPRSDGHGASLQPELLDDPGASGGASESPTGSDTEPATPTNGERIRTRVGAAGHTRTPGERADDATPTGDAGTPGSAAGAVGDRPPSQRGQGRQPTVELGSGDEGEARRDGDVPALPGDVQGQLGGYVCPCGSTEFKYVADHWRPGHVLDPFGGSGTTPAVAEYLERDCTFIDINETTRHLYPGRRRKILHELRTETPLPKQAPGQQPLFTEASA